MLTRREFVRTAALFALAPRIFAECEREIWVNDVHSLLNRTRVRELLRPRTRDELADIVRSASRKGLPISVSGCRHSMGGQQFATDSICIDTRALDRVISFDQERGLIETEAGIQWPKLLRRYLDARRDSANQWGIAQKQTGADTFTLGGSLSSNVHGRGLAMKPLISNIESFILVNADGKSIRCSRDENGELFRLAIGGYGLFGLISSVTLRLVPRQKLRRAVEIIRADDLPKRFEERIVQKFVYGDFQFSVDEKSQDFLQRGVFSCYEPIDEHEPIAAQKELRDDESFLAWAKKPYACIIFNLLTLHRPSGIEASARSFRGLIDLAIARGGSYYLTYHKFAKPEQVLACYPQFKQFLDLKRNYDPTERFQSDWYRCYRKLFTS